MFAQHISPIFQSRHSIWQPKFIAHRGFTPEAPENSLPAFKAAGMKKYWAIEADVHRTQDGVLVCQHDVTIDRMFDGTGEIRQMTWAQLQNYRIHTGNRLESYHADELRMPLFTEYLDICRYYGSVPFIELKAPIVEETIQLVKEYGLEDYAVISTSQFTVLKEVRDYSDRIFIHHIFSSMELAPELAELGNAGLSLNYPDVTEVPEADVRRLHQLGLKVCFRAGDNEQDVKRMTQLGADYIPTNTMYQMTMTSS